MSHSEAPQLNARFRIDAELARGGMGAVFSAFDNATGQQVALKRLSSNAPAEARILFEREYCVLLSLQHPKIIQVYEYGLDAQGPFYTMELLEGADLRELAPMPARDACRYLRDVASSLALLHARRLLHRDVSARNVRTRPDGSCKLIDFGALMSFGTSDQVVGTPPGIAPEALSGQALDQRTDLYSVGALGYFLLTGRHAYPARNVHALPDVWANQLIPPSFYAPETPQELEALVLQLLSLDVLSRPGSAVEVIDRINAIADFEPDHDAQVARAYVRGTQLVERGREIARGERAIARAKEGHGRAWIIEARAGVGKTRLLNEISVRAQLAGMLVLRVDAAEHVGRIATGRALLAQLLRLHPQLADAAFGPHRELLAQAWPDLFWAQAAERAPRDQPTEDEWSALTVLLEEQLYALTQQKPLLLAVDNVPQSDKQSAAMLMALARRARGASLLLVTTARLPRAELSAAMRGLYESASTIALRGLTAQGSQALLRSTFGDVPHAQRTAQRLHQTTHGNLEHSMVLMERWVSDGVVQYVGGGFNLPLSLPPAALPSGDQVALDRLATCSDTARAIACSVAQLDEPVALETCVSLACCEHDSQAVHRALDELLRVDVLVQSAKGLRFHNERLRGLADASLSAEARAALQQRIATHLAEASDGSFAQQTQAGLQLIRAGQRERGAVLIADAARAALAVELPPEQIAVNYKALEAALEVYREIGKTQLEQLELLVALVMASYDISQAVALRHGDATLAALEAALGTAELSRRSEPVALEELLQALAAAPVLEPGCERTDKTPDVLTLVGWLVRAVASLIGVAAAAIDHEAQARHLAPLRPFQLLGPTNPAALVYDFCRMLTTLSEDRFAEAHKGWSELLERLEHADGLTPPILARMRQAAVFALGLLECQLDDSRALARLPVLESAGTPRALAMVAQLGFLYYGFRGDIDKSNECRERLEVHAVQHGSAWQMEVWANCTASAVYSNTRDVAGNKRTLAQLDRLRRQMPALEQYWERAAGTQRLLAGAPARAVELYERTLARSGPRERVGWGAVQGALANAYNDLGQHARAREICEETLRVCADDLDYVAMLLRAQVELCRALGGVGEHEEAQRRLGELFERYLPNENPLTLGTLHHTAAELALARGDILEFEHHLNMMHSYFAPTRNPALIAQSDRLRHRHASALASPNAEDQAAAAGVVGVTVSHTLMTAHGAIERKQRALELIASQTEASSAFMFTRGFGDEPVLLSALGGREPGSRLLDAVRAMFEAIPEDNDETAIASGALTTTAEPIQDHRLLPLTVTVEAKRLLIGAIAVCGARHYRPVSHALLSDLALQLYRAGDMVSARTLG